MADNTFIMTSFSPLENRWIGNVSDMWNISGGSTAAALVEDDSEDDDEGVDFAYIYRILFRYIAPILIFIGTFGNLASFGVLQSKYFRKAPSSFILSALALVDTGVLLTGLLRHWVRSLTNNQVDLRKFSDGSCKVHYFFTYYLAQLSSWSLVLLTLERLVSVKLPFKAKEIFSKSRMMISWAVVAVALAAINAHAFKTVYLFRYVEDNGEVTFWCTYLPATFLFTLDIWPWLDMVLYALAPLGIILICNIMIVIMLTKASKLRQAKMQVTGEDESKAITTMLISISIIFFLTTTPVTIYFLGTKYWPVNTTNTLIAYSVCSLASYLNNSTNFIMYCISGKKFRHALMATYCGKEMKSLQGRSTTDTKTNVTSVSQVDVKTIA